MKSNIKHKIATSFVAWYMKQRGFKAWTSLWNIIYYIDKQAMYNEALERHELKHIEQMQCEGKFKFMMKYCFYSLVYGYKNNPYEVEARKAEND